MRKLKAVISLTLACSLFVQLLAGCTEGGMLRSIHDQQTTISVDMDPDEQMTDKNAEVNSYVQKVIVEELAFDAQEAATMELDVTAHALSTVPTSVFVIDAPVAEYCGNPDLLTKPEQNLVPQAPNSGGHLDQNAVESEGAVSPAAGRYIGSYHNIKWVLDGSGNLSISGSGTVYFNWYDDAGNSLQNLIKSVTVGSGITAIGEQAFISCTNLSSISLPQTVTSIGYGAFGYCSSLKEVTIPDGVTALGDYAFYICTSLKKVFMPSSLKSIGENAFTSCTSLTDLTIPDTVTSIGTAAFSVCTSLGAVKYPSQCTAIPDYAFYGCSSMKTLEIGENVTQIGEHAFTECDGLQTVTIPEAVESMGFAAFALCDGLKEVYIYGAVGENAFSECSNLETVYTAGSCTSIGYYAFSMCVSLKDVQLSDACVSLAEGAFIGCSSLEQFCFPNNLEEIGNYCFYSCTSLREAILPDGLKRIGYTAFGGDSEHGWCSSLTKVRIPASIDSIGAYCFEYCTALVDIELPETLTGELTVFEDYLFTRCSSLQEIDLPEQIEKIGVACFSFCDALTHVEIPAGVYQIGNGCFGLCKSLATVEIPENCTFIGEQAFFGCSSLTSITLPEGVISVEPGTFYECTALTEITLPLTLQNVGSHAFAVCSSLTHIDLPGSVNTVQKYCFANCTELEELVIPEGITQIPEGMFYDCVKLSDLCIPEAVTVIGESAFVHCTALVEITIPAGVTEIARGTFHTCSGLVSVKLMGDVRTIGEYAFANCEKLSDFRIPQTVVTIGEKAFVNCLSWSDAKLPAGLIEIGMAAFANCIGIEEMVIGEQVSKIGDYAFSYCTGLSEITVEAGNAWYCDVEGVLYDKERTILMACPAGWKENTIEILSSVELLSAGAFYGCSALEELTLPACLTEIPDHAFYCCSGLKQISLPENVASIGQYALYGCDSLTQITVPDTVQTIGMGAFSSNPNLKHVVLPGGLTELPEYLFSQCHSLETVELPDGLTSVGEYAFVYCSVLTGIVLPQNIKSVGEAAFAECDALTTLTLPAGVEYIESFLCYGCDHLEEVILEGSVFAVGNYAFSGAEKLAHIQFWGSAPETIGESAFAGTGEELVFEYPQNTDNWTTPEWTGPDGDIYKTNTLYSGDCGKSVVWSLSSYSGTMTISGTGSTYSWSEADMVPWHDMRDQIRTVRVEDGVTGLGAYAFMGCENLTTVTLSKDITEYGYGVFAECTQLSEVQSKAGLADVSMCMFYNCSRLPSVTLDSRAKRIGEYAFYGCTSLRNMTIPQSIEKIGEGAFADCASMQRLTICAEDPDIATGAFLNCGNIDMICFTGTIPDDIHEYALCGINEDTMFYSQEETDTWTSPDGIAYQHMQLNALSGTCGEGLSWEISVTNGVLTVSGNGSMQNYGSKSAPWREYADLINQIRVEPGVTGIGDYSFEDLYNVQEVSIADTVTAIGAYAFSDCASISHAALPGDLTALGEGAFSGCICLESIAIPFGVSRIEPYTFMLCEMLAQVEMPDTVTEIGYAAFYTCPSLKTIVLPASLQTLEGWAFAHCVVLESVSLPDSVTMLGENAFFGCVRLKEIRFNDELSAIGEFACSQTAITSVSLPVGITNIPHGAFEHCDHLTQVTWSADSMIIGDNAFYGCTALRNIVLNDVTEIGKAAFAGSGLVSVYLPQELEKIQDYAFSACGELECITSDSVLYASVDGILYQGDCLQQYPAGKAASRFEVPENVRQIAPGAFYGCCNLEQVTVGQKVESIGETAFALCGSLKEVTLGSGIGVLETAVFGDCAELAAVFFDGNAPQLETDVFYNTHETLTLYFDPETSGWTEGSWEASDGNTYQTHARTSKEQAHFYMSLTEDTSESVQGYDNFTIKIDSFVSAPVQEAIVFLAVYRDQRMLAVVKEEVTLNPEFYYSFTYRTAAEDHQNCVYKAFLLDRDTMIPLTDSVQCYATAELEGYTGDAFLELVEKTACPALPDVEPTPDEIGGFCVDISPATGVAELFGSTDPGNVNTQSGNGYVTMITVDVSDITKDHNAIVSGKVPTETKTESVVPFEIQTDTVIFEKSGTLLDTEKYDIPIVYYDKDGSHIELGATKFSSLKIAGNLAVKGCGFDDNGRMQMPNVELNAGMNYSVLENSVDNGKGWEFLGLRVKNEVNAKVGGVEASVSGEYTSGSFGLGAKVGVDAAEIGDTVTLCTKDGTPILSINASVGVGAEAHASANVGKEKIQLKAGAKMGAGGGIGVTLYPANVLKKCGEAVAEHLQGEFVKHLLVFKTIDENGNVDMVKCFQAVVSTSTGVISPFVEIPMLLANRLSEAAREAALPRSDGGANMPADNISASQENGNSDGIKTEGTATEEEKAQVTENITLTEEQKIQIMIALLRNQWYGIPMPVDIVNMITFAGLGGGLTNQDLQIGGKYLYYTEMGVSSSILFDRIVP